MMLPFLPILPVLSVSGSKTNHLTPFVTLFMNSSAFGIRIALALTVTTVIAAALGCASSAEPTPTLMPPTPTNTPESTSTPLPTATPTPVPATAAELLPPIGPVRTYELRNTQEWLNGQATTIAALRDSGQVVLIDFWTYT